MKQMVEFLAQHGYWVLFVSVLCRQACLPVPANLLLLAAGALAGLGRLNLAGIILFAVAAFLLADTAWYGAGRTWGRKTLLFVCGAAADTEVEAIEPFGAKREGDEREEEEGDLLG